jgi:putative peptidoglycan lipid II flippase
MGLNSISNDNHNTIKNIALYIMLGTLIGKILGFLREMLIGSIFGASHITDAYLVATLIPNILFVSIASAIVTTFIPLYSKIKVSKGNKYSINFTNNILNITFFVSTLISLGGVLFAKSIVSVIAVGFDKSTLQLTINFTRIIFPMIIFIGISYIFTGYLQANGQFLLPSLLSIPNNLAIIFVLIFNKYFGAYGLIYATLIGMLLQAFIQYPFAKKIGYHYSFIFNVKNEEAKDVGILAIPVIISISIQQLNFFIDRMLASRLAEGSIAALNFANKLSGLAFSIFSVSITTLIFPYLSNSYAEKDFVKFKRILSLSLNIITIILIPITVSFIVLGKPIVRAVYERGVFDGRATDMTVAALIYYAIGLVFMGYRDILSRVFYSFQDTKTPMINGAISVILNIIFNFILVNYMKHSGLALSSSLSVIFATVLLYLNVKKRLGFILQNTSSIILKVTIASAIMGFLQYILFLWTNNFIISKSILWYITIFLNILIGFFVYIIVVCFLRIKEFDQFFNSDFLKNFKRKK